TFTPTFAQQYRAILTMQVQSRGLLLVNLLFPASGVVLLLLVFGRLHRAPNFQVHLDWPAIYRVVETGSLFLFYLSPRAVHFLPKSAVSGSQALEELRRLLHQQTGTRARLLLSPTELPSSLASG